MTILEDLLITYRIPAFTRKTKRRLVAHPEFYFFYAGVYRTLQSMGPLDMPDVSMEVDFILYQVAEKVF